MVRVWILCISLWPETCTFLSAVPDTQCAIKDISACIAGGQRSRARGTGCPIRAGGPLSQCTAIIAGRPEKPTH